MLDRFPLRRRDQVRTGDCLQQQQVGGACIVPTGDQAVDHTHLSMCAQYFPLIDQLMTAGDSYNTLVDATGNQQRHRPTTGGRA